MNNPRTKSYPTKLLKLIFGVLFGLVFMVLIILAGLFHFKKDAIAHHFLTSSNQYLNGNLSFDKIMLSDVFDPTNFTIDVQNLVFQLNETPSIQTPIIKAKHLLVGLNLKSILKGEIHVNEIALSNGEIFIKQFSDSTYNLSHIVKRGLAKSDSAKASIALFLQGIHLSNMQVLIESDVYAQHVKMQINELSSVVYFNADSIFFDVNSSAKINHVNSKNKQLIHDVPIQLKATIFKRVSDTVFTIPQFELALRKAHLLGNGTVPVDFPHLYRFSVSGKNDLDLLRTVLTTKALKHIQKGNVNFSGTVKGLANRQVPFVDIKTNIDGLQMDIPGNGDFVSQVDFKAQLNTGVQFAMNDAWLSIDMLNIILPNGYVHLKGNVEDFLNPVVDLNMRSDVNLNTVSRVFKLDKLKAVAGDVKLSFHYAGQRNADKSWNPSPLNTVMLDLNNASFTIPEVGTVSDLFGKVHGRLDSMLVDTLYFNVGNSDIASAGSVRHISALLFESGIATLAHFRIQSAQLDLPDFLHYYPAVKKGFDYRLKQVDIQTTIKIPNKQWHNYDKTPTMHFAFSQSKCVIDSFLPPIVFSGGVFTLTEDTTSTLLHFNHFLIHMDDAQLKGDFHYVIPDSVPQFMHADFQCSHLNPLKIFNYYTSNPDSIHDVRISGQLFSSLTLSDNNKPNNSMEHVVFGGDNLTMTSQSDSFSIQKLRLKTDEISLKKRPDASIFSGVTSSVKLAAYGIAYKTFFVDSVNSTVEVDDGVFVLNHYQAESELYSGTGSIMLSPFTYPPNYSLSVQINKFKFEELLAQIKQTKFLKGNGQIAVILNTKGTTKNELLHALNGNVEVSGDSLIMYGVDIDAFINKLNRSQNFSLVDVGAVLLAGPAGLLVTKGSDITKLLITHANDSSEISQFSNKWSIDNGMMTATDVALATTNNRVALLGAYGLYNDSIHITIAVLDPNGCSAISQQIKGAISKPELGELLVFKALLKPVTNLVGEVLNSDCEPFYQGEVKHPK